jgi:hypothetical protein
LSDNNSLKDFASSIEKIGWQKRFCDLSQDEVIGLIVIAQSLKGIDDEYAGDYLTELYFKYGGKPAEESEIPF